MQPGSVCPAPQMVFSRSLGSSECQREAAAGLETVLWRARDCFTLQPWDPSSKAALEFIVTRLEVFLYFEIMFRCISLYFAWDRICAGE